ncbi:MAG: heme/hemin ABC transporter substrate-binding protein [Sphingobacterium sp.]
MRKTFITIWSLSILCLFVACQNTQTENESEAFDTDSLRIVSLNGTVSEIISELGLIDQIVGTDVASTYPEGLAKKPKVGHNKKIPVEGVLALRPNLIIGTKEDLNQETIEQFQQAGTRLVLLDQQFSTDGTKHLIRALSDSLDLSAKGDSILTAFDQEMAKVADYHKATEKPNVLFIYARGAGTMMVGGTGTQADQVIALAGGINVAKDFEQYRPLTPEALVAYNPDVLLFFHSGLSSLGDQEGLLNVQGVRETNAGKNKKIVAMDGQLLTGFSNRLPQAIQELHAKINQ